MDIESMITKIIESTGLSREQLQKEVEKQIQDMDGLIDEEGALLLVAKNYKIDLNEAQNAASLEKDMKIAEIQPRTYVSVVGRVFSIEPVRTFTRSSGEEGAVFSFYIKDTSGAIRCVAWDFQAKVASEPDFKNGSIVRIVNGLVKENKFGRLEIHVGNRSKIQLNPDDVDPAYIPNDTELDMGKTITHLKDLNLSLPIVNVEARIQNIFPPTEFVSSKTGKKGLRGALIIEEDGNSVRITFWNEDTRKMDNLKIGQRVRITNLRPKKGFPDPSKIELTATSQTAIEVIEDVDAGAQSSETASGANVQDSIVTIKQILENQTGVYNVHTKIIAVEEPRIVSLRNGEQKAVRQIIIADSTGAIPLNLWGEDAEKDWSVDDNVRVISMYTRENKFSGTLEANISRTGKIEKIDEDVEVGPDVRLSINNRQGSFNRAFTSGVGSGVGQSTQINNIPLSDRERIDIGEINSSGYFNFRGMVVKEISRVYIYIACSRCGRKEENCTCPEGFDPVNRMIVNLLVDDGTGPIRITLFGENAEEFLGDSADTVAHLQQTQGYDQYLKKKSQHLLGKEFIFNGRSKFSDFSNSYDVNISNFEKVDYTSESEKLIKELEEEGNT